MHDFNKDECQGGCICMKVCFRKYGLSLSNWQFCKGKPFHLTKTLICNNLR